MRMVGTTPEMKMRGVAGVGTTPEMKMRGGCGGRHYPRNEINK